jgi:AraC-like DNA-binding protein
MVELTAAMYVQVLRALLGDSWRPVRVTFAHAAPKDLRAYREAFGAVEFDRGVDSIVLSQADLDAALPQANAEMAKEIARYIERTATPRLQSAVDIVSDLIVRLLPSGQCTVDEVASRLGVDRRTVHRRLAAEGKSFTQLLEIARREVATEELSRGDQPLGVVTGLVGFSSLSAFSRWFRQTYGIQPSEFRRLAHSA